MPVAQESPRLPFRIGLLPRTLTAALCALLAACGDATPIAPAVSEKADALYAALDANIAHAEGLKKVVDIDHCRLAAGVGEAMPPAHVIIFSNPALDAAIVAERPLAAIDLPLRALAYEVPETHRSVVVRNGFDTLARRHGVPAEMAAAYDASMAEATKGIDEADLEFVVSKPTTDPGIVTRSTRTRRAGCLRTHEYEHEYEHEHE